MKEFLNLNHDKIKLTMILISLFLGILMSVKYEGNLATVGFLGLVILICAFQLKKMKIKL
jgi:hypothetical protein